MRYVFYTLLLNLYLFGSTLDGLIEYATKHSSVSIQSRLQTDKTKLKQLANRVEQYGSLDLVGDYTHYSTARTLSPLTPTAIGSGAPITTTKDLFSIGVTYRVALFTGFADTKELEIDEISHQMSGIRAKLTRAQLIYNIRSLYLSILAQSDMLSAQISNTHTLSKLTDEIALEIRVGKRAQIELLKAKSDYQASHTKQQILRSSIGMTKATLSALVGKSIYTLAPLHFRVKKPRYSTKSLYAKATTLAKMEIETMALSKANRAIAKSRASKLPQVNLSSYIGKNYGEDIATKSWDDETLWQVGINAKWNIIDFGKRDLNIEQARVAQMEAVIQKNQALRDLKKLIIQGVEKIKQSYSEYLGNTTQLNLSHKSEEIERIRYHNNTATLNELLLAQDKRRYAQAKLIESRYNYKKSIYYLDYLLEKGIK